MKGQTEQRQEPAQAAHDATAGRAPGQHPWEEPKLTFIEPKLTRHGKLEEVTAGFFGGFTP